MIRALISFSAAILFVQLAHAVDGLPPSAKQATVRLWTYSQKESKMIESRWTIDVASNSASPEDIAGREMESSRAMRTSADNAAYDRLYTQWRESGIAGNAGDLGAAIDALEESKKWGSYPGVQTRVSPNGDYVVLQPAMENRPIVVDFRTLQTHRLIDHGDMLEIPVAWSPDSRLIAYAPSQAEALFIYDVERQTVQATLPCKRVWVQSIAWSPDMRSLAVVALVRRRLHKTPVGVLEAFSGHPDFRNDLIFQVRDLANQEQPPIPLKSNLSEQNSFQYWIDWGSKRDVISR
jgi:WD40 repeat protein